MSLDFGFLPHVVRDERRRASPTIYTALLSLPCSPVRPHDLDEDKGRLEARLSRTERTPKAATWFMMGNVTNSGIQFLQASARHKSTKLM